MQKNILRLAAVTAAILLIPRIAMQFTTEVNWNLFDFIVAGVLLFGTGLIFVLALQKTREPRYRVAIGISLATAFILIWMNLAVGIIGNEDNPLNLLYFGVILMGMIGALLSRFRPVGMSRTMFTMAGGLLLIPILAFCIKQPSIATRAELMGVLGVFMLSGFFALLFASSALLFRRS